jgi:hypothetical protein
MILVEKVSLSLSGLSKVLAFRWPDLYSYALFSSVIISKGYPFITFSVT